MQNMALWGEKNWDCAMWLKKFSKYICWLDI